MVIIFLGLFLGYAVLEAFQRGLPATYASPVFLGQANLLNLGCSLRGGEGSILGIFIGTAMIQLLRNIVNLQGIDSSLEFRCDGRSHHDRGQS
jgi:hypothetical protein